MPGPDWRKLIADSDVSGVPVPDAHTFHEKYGTAAAPVRLGCSDGFQYVVKGANAGRQPFNDQVVGRIGEQLQAPVPLVAIINVPPELIATEPEMAHMTAGLAHGSRFIKNCYDQTGSLLHIDLDDNRSRFSRLAVLYGLAHASDHQYIYSKAPPEVVWSYDHGHFFPAGPNWTVASLNAASDPVPDPKIMGEAKVTAVELAEGLQTLANLRDDTIAAIVALPPDTWGVSFRERTAMCNFLAVRRDRLLAPFIRRVKEQQFSS